MLFTDKTIWITGASSGIGEALAYTLSGCGARLILSARNAEKLEQVRSQCQNPTQHWVVPLDLSHTHELPTIARRVLGQVGHLDILINNGGISQRGLAKDTAVEVDRRIMEVNFFATVVLTKAVLPSMLKRNAGHIVVISSLMGKFGTPLRSTYAASKHALQGFMDCLRAEIWNKGIKVTVICPGFVKTDISLNALKPDGTRYGVMNKGVENGLPAEVCAKRIAQAIARGEEEVIIAGKEKWGLYLKQFLPSLYNAYIRRGKVL